MRRFFQSILFASIFAFIAPANAANDETALWRSVGNWNVYIDKTVEFQCFITTIYEDNTVFRVGFLKPGSSAAVYIAVGNMNWASIESGKDYDLTIQIDNGSSWNSPASGFRFGGLPSLIVNTNQIDFLDQFMRKHSLQVYFNGQRILNLSLRGSNAALQEMGYCQNAVDSYLGKYKPSARKTDPFAEGNVSPAAKDPFDL
jgi:hypothetical protein